MTITPLSTVYLNGDTFSASDINATNTAVNLVTATQSLISAKGDILAGTADDTLGRTAVGANNTILTADSAQTNGVKWSSTFAGTSGDSNLLNGVASTTADTPSTIAKRDSNGEISAVGFIADNASTNMFYSGGTFTYLAQTCGRIRNSTFINSEIVTGSAVYVSSSGTLGVLSSSRVYKENIVDYDDEEKKLLTVNPVTFDYKDGVLDAEENRFNHFGLIAEDLHDAGLTHLVSYNAEGNPRSVDYIMLSVELLGIVKKQQTAIDDLLVRVQALETN